MPECLKPQRGTGYPGYQLQLINRHRLEADIDINVNEEIVNQRIDLCLFTTVIKIDTFIELQWQPWFWYPKKKLLYSVSNTDFFKVLYQNTFFYR